MRRALTSISGRAVGTGVVGALAVAGVVAHTVTHGTAAVPTSPQPEDVSVQGYRVNLSENPDALEELAQGKDPKDVAGLEEQPTGGPAAPAPSTLAR